MMPPVERIEFFDHELARMLVRLTLQDDARVKGIICDPLIPHAETEARRLLIVAFTGRPYIAADGTRYLPCNVEQA